MPIAKLLTTSVLFSAALGAQTLTGQWDCTVTFNGNEIPFRMEFSADGAGKPELLAHHFFPWPRRQDAWSPCRFRGPRQRRVLHAD